MSLLPKHSNLPAPRVGRGRKELARLKEGTRLIDLWAEKLLPVDALDQSAPDQRARSMILLGVTIMFVLFGIVGLWASFMPLAAGAIAPGKVISESNRKDIQHLEGGIIREILVKDGDQVTDGQILVRLDETNAKAKREQVLAQYLTTKATEARLIAERDGKESITFPEDYVAAEATNPKVKEVLDTQRQLFKTRAEALEGAIGVLNQKIAQSSDEISGLKDQIAAANTQIGLLGQEIKTVGDLVASGNATRPRLLSLQRQQADLVGQRGQAQAMVSQAQQKISESKITILNSKNEFQNKVADELKDTQVLLSSLEEQARATSDVARRVEVTAPMAGTVTNLKVHTLGGVVKPGETLLSLVPAGDDLIVEARVNPQDIDVVHEGLIAQVKLTAFKTRYLRPVEGKVITVSADRVDDPMVNQSYYVARIKIPPEELQSLGGDIKLTPGMPADVLIVTGSRTMLSYIVRPIRDSFGHAFHDQ